jgi:O-antigen ligase
LSEGSNQGRLAVWAKAISISKEHPLLGVGLGAFSYEVNSLSEYRDPIYAHNLYLELLAETGIIGIGLFMAILFVAIQGLRRGLFLSNKKEALLSACLLGSFVWFLIHSFFEMPLYSPVILPLFFLLLAFSSLVEKENRERPRATEPKNKKTPLVLLD